MKKNISLLGSTGSIGKNVLNIIKMFPDRFQVKALAAKKSVKILAEQVEQFRPEMAVLFDQESADQLKSMLPPECRTSVIFGEEGYEAAATLPETDVVVAAMMGAAGLKPTLAGIDAGKTIALANKETLVMAGELVMKRAADKGVSILPIDSEHSAIFQSLSGQRRKDLDKILLTASGGPFLNHSKESFASFSVEDALNHPNWSMGRKITIDSATLMNKGLEVIEAKWLFDVSPDQIEVVVHPQSIIHSMVAYIDGSVIAQMGVPDMKGAIAYALSYPERLPIKMPVPDFPALEKLTFQAPDTEKFRCLKLAFKACETGGTLPAVMNAANEVVVEAFLNRRTPFTAIPEVVDNVMLRHNLVQQPKLEELLAADRWARQAAEEDISRYQTYSK